MSGSLFAQAPDVIDWALAAAPRAMRDAATVIEWKPDYTYDLEAGHEPSRVLRSIERAGPVAVQCTSVGNLDRG